MSRTLAAFALLAFAALCARALPADGERPAASGLARAEAPFAFRLPDGLRLPYDGRSPALPPRHPADRPLPVGPADEDLFRLPPVAAARPAQLPAGRRPGRLRA
jgi:hypothetical protein